MEDLRKFVADKALFEAGINLINFLQTGLCRLRLAIFLIKLS